MKPRIFIGSSREALANAKVIKTELSDVAECQLWNEDFFENNKSYFESLAEGAVLFDFAILVASNDDIQLKRGSVESIARDNIIFEFGLHVGRLGRNRCFLLKENGIDLPSDLFGISLSEFVSDLDGRGKTIYQVCGDIKKRVVELSNTYELSFVPSSVLALGYFQNFVSPVCRELMQASKREVGGKNFNDFKLHIAIPDELPNDFRDQVIAYLNHKNLSEMSVQTDIRKYNFYLDYSQNEQATLELFDLPTTLGALKKAIEMAIPKTFIGEGIREKILKTKEMNNFLHTLAYLVNENPITRKKVIIESIDVES
jgi:hypothetical protein